MKSASVLCTLLVCFGNSLLGFLAANAATLCWDATTSTENSDGGAGTWDAIATNWDSLGFAGADSTWNNVTPDSAVFGGEAGTVSLGEDITTNGLQFHTAGYVLDSGANTLSFGAGTDSIVMARSIAAATITGKVGGAGNVRLTRNSSHVASTLTLNGTSACGWSGTTTVGAGATLALAASNQALLNTTGITLDGGGITLTNTTAAEAALDRVSTTAITANGGTLSFANTSGSDTYAETIGSVALTSGQTNFVLANNQAGSGSQKLTLSGLTRSGSTNTSAVAFLANSLLNTTKNMIVITGAATTPAGKIVGPWATTGNTAGANDYAVYNGSSQVVPANMGGTGQSSWTVATDAYNNDVAIQTLAGTRTITALRNTAATATLSLATGFNLETYGLLNGAVTPLTVAPGTGGVLTTPAGGGDLHVNAGNTTTGGAITISAPINNNGTVTLVKNGLGTLTLSSTTSNYSGGTVVNAGQIIVGAADNMLGTGGITFNGSGTLATTWNLVTSARSITLNNRAEATLNFNGKNTISGAVTGTGGLYVFGNYNDLTLGNTGNNFTGPIWIGARTSESNNGFRLTVNSLSDSASPGEGNITLGWNKSTGGVGQGTKFIWGSGAISALVLDNRQFELAGGATSNVNYTTIRNDNTDSARTITIHSDLLVTATVSARTLYLAGVNTGDNTFAGRIADGAVAVGVYKGDQRTPGDASGVWVLSGNNTYTGATTVAENILRIQHANALGSTATGTSVVAAAQLQLQGGISYAAEGLSLVSTNTSAHLPFRSISGNNTWNGAITSTGGGTLLRVQSDADLLTVAGTVTNGTVNTTQFVLQGAGNITVAGLVSGPAQMTSGSTGAGVRTLSNDSNLYTGKTNVTGGTLDFTSIANIGAANSSLGAPANATDGTIALGGTVAAGALRYTGTAIGGHTSNRVIDLAGTTFGATIEANGTDPLVLTGTNTASGAGVKTLTLGGTNTGNNSIGAIVDNSVSNTTSLVKSAAGKWVLTGANTYTGGTTVTDGTLTINGSLADATMSVSSGTVNGTGALTYNINGFVADQAVASGGTIDISNLTVAVNATGSGLTETEYVLVNATGGTLSGAFAGLSGAPGYMLDYGTANQVKLVLTGGSAYDTWKNANAPGSNPEDDTDGDGVENAVEFVLGGTSATDDLDKLPVIATDGTHMTFTFERDQDSIDPGTALSIEVSTDLATWNTAPSPYAVTDADTGVVVPGVEVDANNPAAGTDTVILTVPMAPDAAKFARLKVLITP